MHTVTWVETAFQQFMGSVDGRPMLYAGINGDGCAYWNMAVGDKGRASRLPQTGLTCPMAYANACIRNMQTEAEAAAIKWLEG